MRKEIVIAGVALIFAGFILSVVPIQESYQTQQPYTYNRTDTTDHFVIQKAIGALSKVSWDPFIAQNGYWIELSISASDTVRINIYGDTYGSIFDVTANSFTQTVNVYQTDTYHIEIYNNHWFSTVTVSGDIYVKTTTPATGYNSITNYRTIYPFLYIGIPMAIIGIVIAALAMVTVQPLPKTVPAPPQ